MWEELLLKSQKVYIMFSDTYGESRLSLYFIYDQHTEFFFAIKPQNWNFSAVIFHIYKSYSHF